MVELPVPARRLNPGSVVQADDLRMARVRAGLGRGEVVRDVAAATGMTLRRQAVPGQPIALGDLTATPLVVKGARVTMELRAGGLDLAAVGVALEPGVAGDRIRVLNPVSRAVVEAEIVAPERVRVMPGSMPLSLPANRTAQLVAGARALP
jgi:flagella basal body P-ring formation protein FlgA